MHNAPLPVNLRGKCSQHNFEGAGWVCVCPPARPREFVERRAATHFAAMRIHCVGDVVEVDRQIFCALPGLNQKLVFVRNIMSFHGEWAWFCDKLHRMYQKAYATRPHSARRTRQTDRAKPQKCPGPEPRHRQQCSYRERKLRPPAGRLSKAVRQVSKPSYQRARHEGCQREKRLTRGGIVVGNAMLPLSWKGGLILDPRHPGTPLTKLFGFFVE